jgi:hypothetical protein
MEKDISDCQFWNVYPMKMRGLTLILIATGLNALKMYMKLHFRLDIGKVNLNKETSIYN